MKQLNHLTLKALVLMVLVGGLAGCGSSSSGGGASTPPINGCVGTNCYYVTPTNGLKGFYAQSANMPSGIFINNGSSFSLTNSPTPLLEEAMGVCNRGYYNGGLADCDTWYNGYYDLVFILDQTDLNKVTIVFRAYPAVGSSYYTYNLPRWDQFFASLIGMPIAWNPQGTFNPMILQGTIHPVNNSQGFEIRAYGPTQSAGSGQIVQIQVPKGKIEDSRFNFDMAWHGKHFARGVLVRCQSATCGM